MSEIETKKILRILYVEDDLCDRELVARSLASDGLRCDFHFVATETEFKAALAHADFDVILSDFNLPGFNGKAALALAKAAKPEVPFLFVSGTIGEERAVESLKLGATDFVTKRHLNRLPEAIRRALREANQISERMRAIEALRESEQRFRQVTESIEEVFWLTDLVKRQMIYISPAYERIWGRPCESLYNSPQSWMEAIHPEDRERIKNAAATQQVLGMYDVKYRIIRPDGRERWIHDRAFPVKDGEGKIYRLAGVAEDISLHTQLEAQFRQAQKMEAVGHFAGGIAHDFNNLLAVIQMQASLLLTEPGVGSDIKSCIQEIMAAAERAGDLTRRLLTFSRRETKRSRTLDLSEVLGNMIKLLRRIIGARIDLETRFAPSIPLVDADPGMVEQVLMNLVVNARDAMPEGGRLTVTLETGAPNGSQGTAQPGAGPAGFVCMTVRDSGCGIPSENLSRIFEPFFTTKESGKGTGLGLATVFGIVEQHHGKIEVESAVNKGTAFRVYFPALQESASETLLEVRKQSDRGGNETVLLVEDDLLVSAVARAVLERYGYRVFEAATATVAVELWKSQRGSIDLLLTDFIIPDGMLGPELADELLADKPELKIIYTSGYSDEIIGPRLSRDSGRRFLQKPYSANQLAASVRECLDDGARAGTT